MIARYAIMAIAAGVAMACLVLGLVALGVDARGGAWLLVVGAIAALVALWERRRIRAEPIDASRPGIVPGDE